MPQQSWVARPSLARPQRQSEAPQAPREPVPFWDAVGRAGGDQMVNSNDGGRSAEWMRYLRERHRNIERITGQTLSWSEEMRGSSAFGAEVAQDLDPYGADAGVRRQAQARSLSEQDYEAQLVQLRRRYPELATIPDINALRQQFDFDLRMRRQRADQGAEDQPVGAFLGGAAASMVDLPNVVATAATGGIGASRPLLGRMAAQAAANAGIEAVAAPGRAQQAAALGGPEYTGAQAGADILFAGAGGAGFEAIGAGLQGSLRAIGRRLGDAAEPEARGAAAQIERLLDDEDMIGEGADDFDAARRSVLTGDLPAESPPERGLEELFANQSATVRNQMQRETGAGSIPALDEAEYFGRRIYAGRFDPLQVEADPARFQYKADGDAEGVTGRLRGVERWDATASGKAILFEEDGGRMIVADGHQRRGLARRLAEQGWEDARLDGYLFREADGWSARDVRVVAALKNIREGSGATLDAAKLFREAPAALKDRSLPVTGDFIHQARQLASLSDEAFGAVVNGTVPERFAAVVGEQAPTRPELHGDLVELIRRGEPRSVEGARALVQEGLLDDFIKSEGRQMDLFGGLPRESTVIARGRIREAVMAALRRDEKLNAALVRNAEAIEAGGNVLARTENERRLAVDRAASELVSRLALRSGEMGEAFAEAATAVTKGDTTPGAAAKGLTARIRAAVAAGERLDEVRAEVIDPSPPSPQALETVNVFDRPGGAGQRDQIAPKPEDAELEGEDSLGLFDDLPTVVPEERAVAVLRACAPGGA